MGECVARMRECFAALGRGEAVNVPRRRLMLATGTVMHQMAGAWGGYLGTKIYATNVKRGAMHFHVLLYDAASAEPLALIEANHLGQMRTGAATGVATDLLAPAEVSTVALIGSGTQAWTQLEAVLTVRRDGTQLFAQLTGQPEFPIFPTAEDSFEWRVVKANIRFVKGEDGKVVKAVHSQGGRTFDAAKIK